jgi:AcrR family transcriptional regulator
MMTTIEARPSGRPRSMEADRAILRAALELCAAEGFEGTTVEAVAARAGVGKATVYRRYPNRVGLVVAAATEVCCGLADHADTGSVREDLRLVAHGIVQTVRSDLTRAMLVQIAAAAARLPELRAAQHQFVATRRTVAVTAIRKGIARGELRSDTDPDLMADLIAAPLLHRAVTLGDAVDECYGDALVDAAIAAFSPR